MLVLVFQSQYKKKKVGTRTGRWAKAQFGQLKISESKNDAEFYFLPFLYSDIFCICYISPSRPSEKVVKLINHESCHQSNSL